MANHNPIGDSRMVAAEKFFIDEKHIGQPLLVTTELIIPPVWQVVQDNYQAYVAGMDKNPRPMEPMNRLQLGMIGALEGKRVDVNVSVVTLWPGDVAPEEPESELTITFYAGDELLESFSKKRNQFPASFYAKLYIAIQK